MRVVNVQEQEQYEKELAQIEAQYEQSKSNHEARKPVPINLKLHKGELPKELDNGVTVGSGTYYTTTDRPIAISADDIGEDKFWKEVK